MFKLLKEATMKGIRPNTETVVEVDATRLENLEAAA